jgi:hypothetical protein
MCLDPIGEGRSGETRDPQPWVVELRLPGLLGKCDPDLRWALSSQSVKTQRGQEAEDAPRHTFGYLRKGMFGGERMLARNVNASRLPLDETAADKLIKLPAGDSVGLDVCRPHDPELTDKLECLLVPTRGHNGWMIQYVGEYLQVPTLCSSTRQKTG